MSLVNVPKLQELFFHPHKLPLETLTLVDDDFYDFIEHLVGQTLSRLLRVQEINSVPILLLTADVFAHLFLKINDFETDLLRQELLLKIDNNNSIVKSASRTKIKCLLDILMMASDRKMKQSIRSTLTTQINPAPLLNPSATAITATTTITPTTTVSSALTLHDQRNHLLKCIDDWTSQSENYLNLKKLKLKEGENFKLNLTTGISGFEATIQCQCKTKTALGKLNGKLIPSNFYRHLKSSTCKFMKRLLKEQKDKENVNNSTSDPTAPSSSSQSRQFSNSNSQLTIPVLRSNRKRSFRSTTADIKRQKQ
jgi:hypothetical protein